jgi:hypothetical protein
MTNSLDSTQNDDPGLLLFVWRTMAGLLVVAGVIYGGTVLIESLLPALPDQAHAGMATPSGASTAPYAGPSRPHAITPVEHFHAQFNLQPGRDAQAHVEAF